VKDIGIEERTNRMERLRERVGLGSMKKKQRKKDGCEDDEDKRNGKVLRCWNQSDEYWTKRRRKSKKKRTYLTEMN